MLREVSIEAEGLANAELLHHRERDAVDEVVVLVETRREELPGGSGYNTQAGRRLLKPVHPRDALTESPVEPDSEPHADKRAEKRAASDNHAPHPLIAYQSTISNGRANSRSDRTNSDLDGRDAQEWAEREK